MIRNCKESDSRQISEIYNYYIEDTIITFEEKLISEGEIRNRINTVCKSYPWLVYEQENQIVGYAYANRWNVRSAYKYSVETTIYIKNGLDGKGIGTQLYQELIQRLKNQSIHCVIGIIALPNQASIKLHEKLGFKKVAHFEQVGRKFGRWIDVGYWQLLME